MFTDPRLRQSWNNFTGSVDRANRSVQAALYSAHTACLSPCLSAIESSTRPIVDAACPCCLSLTDPEYSRARRRARSGLSRAQQRFDFYDDWDNEDGGNDELDGLLAGSRVYGGIDWRGRGTGMTYGTIGGKTREAGDNDRGDPTVVPKSNVFGFLERLPFVGARGVRYKPSAADLQINPGSRSKIGGFGHIDPDAEPLFENVADDLASESTESKGKRHRRTRSGTVSSGNTQETLSSRGDLFPSSDEEDAKVLDDEFAMALRFKSQEGVGVGSLAPSSKRRPGGSRTVSAKSVRGGGRSKGSSFRENAATKDTGASRSGTDDLARSQLEEEPRPNEPGNADGQVMAAMGEGRAADPDQ